MYLFPSTPPSMTALQSAQFLLAAKYDVDGDTRVLEEWTLGWWIFLMFAVCLFLFTSICMCALAFSFHRGTQVGVSYCYELTEENKDNLLPIKKEVQTKMLFEMADIICLSVPHTQARGNDFRVDQQYHDPAGTGEERDLEVFEHFEEENELPGLTSNNPNRNPNKGGWSLRDMYTANEDLGVTSSYKPDLSQFTNVSVPEVDRKARENAERIAREIEQSNDSRRNAMLENDDDERDLDKYTDDQELDLEGEKWHRPRRSNNDKAGRDSQKNFATRRIQPNPPVRAERNDARPVQKQAWSANNDQNRGLKNGKAPAPQNAPPVRQNSNDVRTQQARRTSELRAFHNDFHLAEAPAKKEAKPVSAPRAVASAWNKGPPQSLVASSSTPEPPAGPTTERRQDAPAPVQAVQAKKSEPEERQPEPAAQPAPVANKAQPSNQEKLEGKEATAETSTPATESTPETEDEDKKQPKEFKFNPNAAAFVPTKKPDTPEGYTPSHTPRMNQQPMHHQAGPPIAYQPQPTHVSSPVVLQYPNQGHMYQPMPYQQYPQPPMPPRTPSFPAPIYPNQQFAGPVFPANMNVYYPNGYPVNPAAPQQPPQPNFMPQLAMPGGQPMVSIAYMPQQYQGHMQGAAYANSPGAQNPQQRFQAPPRPRTANGVDNFQGPASNAGPANQQPPNMGPHQVPVSQLMSGYATNAYPTQPPAAGQFVIAPAQAPMFYGNQQMYYHQSAMMQHPPQHLQGQPSRNDSPHDQGVQQHPPYEHYNPAQMAHLQHAQQFVGPNQQAMPPPPPNTAPVPLMDLTNDSGITRSASPTPRPDQAAQNQMTSSSSTPALSYQNGPAGFANNSQLPAASPAENH
ncbi:unnamed protein product, partial [Mesorhabditis spiculigera]